MSIRSAVLPLLLLLLPVTAGCDDLVQGYEQGFKESYERELTKSCTKGAVAKGTEQAAAQTMCGCMAKKLTARYSTAKLTALGANPDSQDTEKVMAEVAQECAEKL